jgi:hypothetical protein
MKSNNSENKSSTKLQSIGELNFEKFRTEVYIVPEIKKIFKTNKISLSTLIPTAWCWYDAELLDAIDENGDGKPDEKFGKEFKLIYLQDSDKIVEFEKQALLFSTITIKGIKLKYIAVKI